MFAPITQAHSNGQPHVTEQTETEIRRVINRAVLEAADNFIGLVGNPFDQGDLFNDLYGSNWYANPYFMPPYWFQSQKRGEVIPVYLNELQLRYIRDRQRKLCSENPYAQCAIAAFQNYAVGEDGLMLTVIPAHHREANPSHIRQTQRVLDVWNEENDIPSYARDMVETWIVNGDIITRHFPQRDGIVWLRRVEAEHLKAPLGDGYDARYSFGIETAPDDIEDVRGYWIVMNPLENPVPVFVPADEITFLKWNTPRSAKRGRPLFDGGCEVLLRGAMELLRATMATVTSRAKIALIRKFNGVVKDAAQKLVQELTTQTVTDPGNGQLQSMQKVHYGTILNSSGGVEYEMPAQNFETNIHYQALQMVLRAVCARAQFPEWMLTADPSSGTFANAFIAEAPSTKQFGMVQKTICQFVGSNRRLRHRSMAWIQVVHAVDRGLLPEDVLHTVQIETRGPTLVVRDKEAEARTNTIYMAARIKPPQMVQQELGIDPSAADKMWDEWDKKQAKVDDAPVDTEVVAQAAAVGNPRWRTAHC